MKLTRLLFPLTLVIVLLLTQLGAALHDFSHALSKQSQSHTLAHDKSCAQCVVYAQIGGAISVASIQFAVLIQAVQFLATSFSAFDSATFTAFSARAPPRFE